MSQKIMLVAGEASGDQHAANMFLELKKLLPNIKGFGMGGQKMSEAGIDVRFDSASIAVIGLIEVIKHYSEIKQALKLMQALVISENPDLLVCVDYKEFNYKLATHAKRHGIKVLFYVSPQVWAWRPGRVVKYGKVIDMMAVIFPFETRYYEEKNIPVSYVGHPSVDKVHPQYSIVNAKALFDLNSDHPIVGLLPGSRGNEIARMMPVMLEAVEKIAKQIPDTQFLLPQADSVSDEMLQPYLQASPAQIKVIKNQPYDVIQCCDAVMTTSGTATLEIALLTVPMVISYRLSPITYWLGRLLVKTPFIGLPNIIVGKLIIKELIQHHATGNNLAAEICKILTDPEYRETMCQKLSNVKNKLGTGGGSKNMAKLAAKMISSNESVF
jgi:lipid-A-disaccharide synthase